MAEDSKIEWTDNTFNPWWGCTAVSPACANCYAETFAARFGVGWGKNAARRFFGDKHWNEPVKWDRKAASEGRKTKVFCASMADVFEDNNYTEPETGRTLDGERAVLFHLIERTPNLIWLLLTKRPENMARLAPAHWESGWPSNVWAMTTVEDQRRADERIHELLKVPAVVHGLSMEPLFGKVVLPPDFLALGKASWVIAGGESGHNARPSHPFWFGDLRDQCAAAGVPFLFKQWGEWAPAQSTPATDLPDDEGHSLIMAETGEITRSRSYDEQVRFCAEHAGTMPLYRKGKKAAGRMLNDGRTWDGFPEPEGGVQ